MEMYHYVFNPFADTGILCTICECPVTLHGHLTIEASIKRHELSKTHGNIRLSYIARSNVANSFKQKMKEISVVVQQNLPNDENVYVELLPFLNTPARPFPYCTLCFKMVASVDNHFGGRHKGSCHQTKDGYSIKDWNTRDPGIIPSPLKLDNTSIFCVSVRNFLGTATNDTGTASDNNDTLVTATDSQAQLALDVILATQNERFQVDPANRIIQIHDHFAEPNLWLIRTGYDILFHGVNMMSLFNVASQGLSDDEVDIRRILGRVESITDDAIAFAKSIDRSNLVLMEVKRIDHRPANRPFNTTLKPETWEKYKRLLRTVVTIIFRLETGDPSRKRYLLTEEQKTLFQSALVDRDNQQTNRFYLDLLFSLLRQRMIEKSYECVLLSALAVMSIKRDATYLPPNDTTQFYAGLIALFRALILHAARNFPLNQGGFLENAREFTNELMIHPDSSRNPGAMAWIFHTFSFAKVISQNTMQPGRCYWDNDVLVYRGTTHFSMVQFRLMLAHFIAEAKALIAELLFLPADHTGLDVPTIHWDKIVDEMHDNRPGYSFLSEPRNTWIAEKYHFLSKKVRNDPGLAEKWYDPETEAINLSTLNEYGEKVEKLRRILFGLMHFTSGQPARGTEVSNVRFENTSTPRNIIIDRRLVAIRTSYHKMMLQTEQPKNIYRYLPPCVGELLVHYLWLVLPFWQTMKGYTLDSREKSTFLWSKDLVYPMNKQVTASDLWDTNKLSSILNSMMKTTMGVEMNISSWRHIAIAISRRFLKQAFTDPTDDDEEDDDNAGLVGEDVDGGNGIRPRNLNSIYDLQAAHSVRTAYHVYAVSKQGPNETPMDMVDAYRHASVEWHKLLFPDMIVLTPNHKDDPHELYRSFMFRLRVRRLTDLANVDLTNRLRLFSNKVDANYRGNQEDVLQAVVRGDQVVLQVAATGSGKSYSFMIPAFCSPDGTTIVIVPLVSLQNDMLRRCSEHQITSKIWTESSRFASPVLLFVTPESAVTKAFMDYVSTLIYSHKLDRIVFDECHSVIFGGGDFRPRFHDLKHLLQRTGVQVLLLTATLPEKYESELIKFLGLEGRSVSKFRATTSRSNIQYIVRNGVRNRDGWLSAISSEAKSDSRGGKCIIYCRRLDDGQFIASNLSLPFYHSNVGTRDEKEMLLEEFVRNGT